LNSAYGLSAQAAAGALRGAGYTVHEVGSALGTVYNVSGQAAASVLQGAGYAAAEVGSFVGDVGGAVSDVIDAIPTPW
jgi:hypothetical protein